MVGSPPITSRISLHALFVRNDAVQKHAERMVDIASFRARAATYFAV